MNGAACRETVVESAPMSPPSGARTTAKQKAKAAAIVAVAQTLFVEEGFPNFGLRPVAAACRMRLANLQYYFPTIDDLLGATVSNLLDQYTEGIQRIGKGEGAASVRLVQTIEYLLEAVQQPQTCRLCFDVWSIAQRDMTIQAIVRTAYTLYREAFCVLMAECNPALSRDQLVARSTLLAAQLDGIMIYSFDGGPGVGDWGLLTRTCIESALRLLELPAVAGPGEGRSQV